MHFNHTLYCALEYIQLLNMVEKRGVFNLFFFLEERKTPSDLEVVEMHFLNDSSNIQLQLEKKLNLPCGPSKNKFYDLKQVQ